MFISSVVSQLISQRRPSGTGGASIGRGGGTKFVVPSGGEQTRLVACEAQRRLARRMPANWRGDCHAARVAACRMGNPASSQRDSEAAGVGAQDAVISQ